MCCCIVGWLYLTIMYFICSEKLEKDISNIFTTKWWMFKDIDILTLFKHYIIYTCLKSWEYPINRYYFSSLFISLKISSYKSELNYILIYKAKVDMLLR
jgi:hypothetical protein